MLEEGPTVTNKNGHEFAPYEFKWIEEIGTNMKKKKFIVEE